MKLDFKFVKACKETEVELDGVIRALGGTYPPPPPPNPKTIVTYLNGDIVEYEIVGELEQNSIPNKTNIVKVEIGTLVSRIGNNAFYNYSNLSSVIISDTVTSIGSDAFFNLILIKEIVIPKSIATIETGAFEKSGFETITFEGRTIAEVQTMQSYPWLLAESPGGTFQRTIICSDGTFTITAEHHGGPT